MDFRLSEEQQQFTDSLRRWIERDYTFEARQKIVTSPSGVSDAAYASLVDLGALGDVEVGIWEMTTGVARDTEAEEIFIVLSGSGVVEFEDGSTVNLAPGVAIRLHAGERTRWTITETLRKVYVAVA